MKSLSLLAVVTLAPGLARAAQDAPIAELLRRAIIGPDLALHEVQAYTEARVAPLPAAGSLPEWRRESARLRRAVLDRIVFQGDAVRWREARTGVEWLEAIEGGPGYRIRKLRYEALPGLWVPALLYEPERRSGRIPVILNVNGHDPDGKAARYKQIRCINQAKRGIAALNVEWLGMGQLRSDGFAHYRMNQLDLCGTSGLAPFYLSMKRGLDLLLSLDYADPERVGVTGLSGGGWQTILISALDERVTLSNPVAGYSGFRTRVRNLSDLGDSEQTPNDLAALADYTHLSALLAPRATLLTYNAKDQCCFAAGHALQPLLDAAAPFFALFGRPDRLRSHVNADPGTHNYELDNRKAHYRLLGDIFQVGDDAEVPSESEVKTSEQLHVPLPGDNLDLHRLALAASARLPRPGARPDRSRLREIVRAEDYRVEAGRAGAQVRGTTRVEFWRLKLGGAWTVPAVELTRGKANGTTLVVADVGRASIGEAVERMLGSGRRVVAVDPFYFGESKIAQKDFLFALLVASVGRRALGIQASQINAVARWLKDDRGAGPVTLAAIGPRSSTFALVAAALDRKAISALDLTGTLGSLREVIERDWTVDKFPELFCFGLLEEFDVGRLRELVHPRPIRVDTAK